MVVKGWAFKGGLLRVGFYRLGFMCRFYVWAFTDGRL